MSALVISGGRGHPPHATAPALRRVLGADARVVEGIDDGLRLLDSSRHDLLVVNALGFRMLDARYDDETRRGHAFELDDAGRAVIEAWVGAGRPLLALHTALICFDDWPRWGDILGGAWQWGRSWHPPIGTVTVTVGSSDTFEVVDERYTDLRVGADVEVLATAAGQPVVWRRREGAARIACSALGHDARSLDTPRHQALLRALVDWLREDACQT